MDTGIALGLYPRCSCVPPHIAADLALLFAVAAVPAFLRFAAVAVSVFVENFLLTSATFLPLFSFVSSFASLQIEDSSCARMFYLGTQVSISGYNG